MKYKDFSLLWFLVAGTLLLVVSWPLKKRIILESDLYQPKIKAKQGDFQVQKPAKMDINRADFSEIVQISGIGPVLARRILGDRLKNGPYRKMEDLLRVKGIGPKKLAKIQEIAEIRSPLESSP